MSYLQIMLMSISLQLGSRRWAGRSWVAIRSKNMLFVTCVTYQLLSLNRVPLTAKQQCIGETAA